MPRLIERKKPKPKSPYVASVIFFSPQRIPRCRPGHAVADSTHSGTPHLERALPAPLWSYGKLAKQPSHLPPTARQHSHPRRCHPSVRIPPTSPRPHWRRSNPHREAGSAKVAAGDALPRPHLRVVLLHTQAQMQGLPRQLAAKPAGHAGSNRAAAHVPLQTALPIPVAADHAGADRAEAIPIGVRAAFG